ncbi:alpha-1B-glycoprotein-like [Tenrec ecaudatus]|uniref:alpha-1B-glycoprotein-like n=1 Tax=Tenrec ecaudatus TaxID=94439 RepID=UPI003F598FA3
MGRTPTKLCSGSLRDWRGEDSGTALLTILLLLGFCPGTSVALSYIPQEKSTLSFEVESLEHPWDNVTLICRSPNEAQAFQLLKDGVAQDPVHLRPHAREHRFPLGKVTEDTRGIYRCKHTSFLPITIHMSDLVEVTGREYFPAPSLSAEPVPWLARGLRTTLLCQGPMSELHFSLMREGDLQVVTKWAYKETNAIFDVVLPGNYSCSYTTALGNASEPSPTVTIEELNFFPAPSMTLISEVIQKPGSSVYLRCSAPIGGITWTLMKSGERVREESRASAVPTSMRFTVPIEEGGVYTCKYTLSSVHTVWSSPSNPVEIFVSDGSLPEPKLSLVSEGLGLTTGSEVVLRCQGSLTGAIFLLLQEKARRPLQAVSSTGSSADFRIPELTAQDSGKYRCLYLRTRHGTSGSWLSNALELSVAGLLPKPLLWSVWSDTVTAGRDAKLQCRSPLPDMHFELLREGEVVLHFWGWTDNYVADFTLSNVGPQDAGNYSCRYSPPENHSATRSEDSDALELRVQRAL